MRTLSILLTAFLALSFKPVKVKNKDFQVISATKQTIYGGVAGSPVTTSFVIRLKALRSFTLTADSLFSDNKADRFGIMKDSFNQVDVMKVKKGQTIDIVASIKTATEMGGSDYQLKIPGSPDSITPKEVAEGVMLRYYGGKNKCLIIKTVIKKQDIFMP